MTEEEKKEFEEFLLWKKEREKQKSEEPVNAPNSGAGGRGFESRRPDRI